jgi:hypothetical protein
MNDNSRLEVMAVFKLEIISHPSGVDLRHWIRILLISLILSSQTGHTDECPIPDLSETDAAAGWQFLSSIKVSGVFDQAVYLNHGQYQGQAWPDSHSRPELKLWPELFAIGDLDGQAGDEVVGLLSETSGGSGERVYLVVTQMAGNSNQTWPAALLGDRVKLRALSIHDRQIVLDVVEAGPGQPLCCGTELNRQIWRLDNDKLSLMEKQLQGHLSIRAWAGARWYLLDRPGDRLQAVHPSCTYLSVEGNQIVIEVSGRRYLGKLTEYSPGRINISDITSDDAGNNNGMALPQNSLLKQLALVNQYSFRAGRLLLVGFENQRVLSFEFAIMPAE